MRSNRSSTFSSSLRLNSTILLWSGTWQMTNEARMITKVGATSSNSGTLAGLMA